MRRVSRRGHDQELKRARAASCGSSGHSRPSKSETGNETEIRVSRKRKTNISILYRSGARAWRDARVFLSLDARKIRVPPLRRTISRRGISARKRTLSLSLFVSPDSRRRDPLGAPVRRFAKTRRGSFEAQTREESRRDSALSAPVVHVLFSTATWATLPCRRLHTQRTFEKGGPSDQGFVRWTSHTVCSSS